MGNILRILLAPLSNYPMQRGPICFHRQQDFNSAGFPISESEREQRRVACQNTGALHEYSVLLEDFHMAMLQRRKQIRKQTVHQWHAEMVAARFLGWDAITVAYLHSLFLLFDQAKRGTLRLSDFCTLLESLGDDSTMEERKLNFVKADGDEDGNITYDEYLPLMYNFNPSILGRLGKLARLCQEVAHRMEFVDSLSVGEQLMYGLF